VKSSGAIEESLAAARSYADSARAALRPLEGTVAGRSLGAAAEGLIDRVAIIATR
jgi:hypothetical protein